jgi:hypothetical protein
MHLVIGPPSHPAMQPKKARRRPRQGNRQQKSPQTRAFGSFIQPRFIKMID